MSKASLFLLLSLLTLSATSAQRRMRIMEWNVENLFDTLHCEGKQDMDFTPSGARQWTSSRYWSKLSHIARAISAIGGDTPCDIVALTEVENDSVMHHLTHQTRMWRMGYEYIMAGTSDVRGIGVGLLYQSRRFRPVSIDTLRFKPLKGNMHPTRDALHVAGETITGDTLDVIVCHWPSRRDGKRSQRFRESVAKRTRSFCDSIFSTRAKPYIVITGDFNSWYPENSISKELCVLLPEDSLSPHSLYILSHRLHAGDGIEGTYKYQGEWDRLDHFITSGTLLNGQGTLRTTENKCAIANLPFLLEKEKSGNGTRPRRTFLGTYYNGGCSDHLPLVLDIMF